MSHSNDRYYKQAKDSNFRARSAFKLLQINSKFQLFTKPRYFPKKVLDLGAHPGSWLQAIIQEYNKFYPYNPEKKTPKLLITAVDMRTIKPLDGIENPMIKIEYVRGDIFKESTEEIIKKNGPYDLILSDLAPKTAGNFKDVAIQVSMVRKVLEYIEKYLKKSGSTVVKIYESPDLHSLTLSYKEVFKTLNLTKPRASKVKSREKYFVGKIKKFN